MYAVSDTVFQLDSKRYRLVVYPGGRAALYRWVLTPQGAIWRYAGDGTSHPMHQALCQTPETA